MVPGTSASTPTSTEAAAAQMVVLAGAGTAGASAPAAPVAASGASEPGGLGDDDPLDIGIDVQMHAPAEDAAALRGPGPDRSPVLNGARESAI